MRLLLLNNNPAVSRLIKLSVDKVGYAMDEFDDYGLVPLTNYDVIMVDNELYDEAELKALSEQVHCEYFLYICQRGSEKPALMNVSLEKPFLPTDFLTLLEKVKNVVNSFKVDVPEEEPLPLEENSDDTMQAFDIDDIDTFGIEEENELDLLEEKEDDIEEENETKLAFEDIEDHEIKDDALHLTLDLEDEGDELSPSVSDSLADFDFEEDEEVFEKEKEKENEEVDSFEEISSSILDKDDINEVKQLLNESNDEDEKEEGFDFSFDKTTEDLIEEDDNKDFSFDKDFATQEIEEEDLEEALTLEEMTLDNPQENEVDDMIEEELPLETQEEIIDDFAEEIEEKIEEEAEQEAVEPTVVFKMEDIDSLDVESLDDLNENLLKKAFGEEVEEEEAPQESVHEIEVMRGEIESSIARSISSFAQSDILREALKGMKINISITFDEKN